MARVEGYFGACSHDKEQLGLEVAEKISGTSVKDILRTKSLPLQVAVADAYLGFKFPHKDFCKKHIKIKGGTPIEKAYARDELISDVANIEKGKKVALIGVVDPLIEFINKKGGICLPCDLQVEKTANGDIVEKDMEVVLKKADNVICTAMTLSNDTFSRILEVVRDKNIPLTLYAQTGSAVVARFVKDGVTSLIAEPFPFTQFSSGETDIYLY